MAGLEHAPRCVASVSRALIHRAAVIPAASAPVPLALRERASNQVPPTRGLRNVPDSESDESYPEVVEVRDPHHPLWGRSYRVIRKISQRGRGIPAVYEVEYRAGSSLLIQATAIEYYEQEVNEIKLSMEALLELLSTADCPDAHEHGSNRSLVDGDAALRRRIHFASVSARIKATISSRERTGTSAFNCAPLASFYAAPKAGFGHAIAKKSRGDVRTTNRLPHRKLSTIRCPFGKEPLWPTFK